MTWIVNIWIAIIIVEIFRNWCIIEVGKKRPTYWWSNVLRVFVGFVFWVLAKVFSDINQAQWWAMIPMMLFTFWWIFDYGLNVFRNFMQQFENTPKQKIMVYYLNPNGSWLDRMQCKYPDAQPWFFYKLIFMIGGIALFYYGIDAIWTAKW